MKKTIIPLLLLLLCTNVFAQKKIYVLDSVTKKTLPFAEVEIGKSGAYTNEKGFFIFQNDTIEKGTIHFLGYKSRFVNLTKMDTVLLKPKHYELDEVILSTKNKKIKIDFLHINKRYFGDFPLFKESEILTIVTPKSNKLIGKLKKVLFKVKKNKKETHPKVSKTFIRMNIYLNDSTQTKIYTSKGYEVKKTKKDLITINLSDEFISIPKEGLVFGIEYIGDINENGNFIDNSKMGVRTSLTDEESNLYNQTTFLRSSLTKKIFIKSFYKYFYSLDKKKEYNRNLSISFVLNK